MIKETEIVFVSCEQKGCSGCFYNKGLMDCDASDQEQEDCIKAHINGTNALYKQKIEVTHER